jgi:hypothetical protein
MAKIGRNDPCPCGSGKKYKQCHLPVEEAARAESLQLRRAIDTLMPTLIDTARTMPDAVSAAFPRYWQDKYQPEQLAELDDHEDRGADRFLTWFVFDYRLEHGQTMVEQRAADPGDLELTPHEAALLLGWGATRLRAYVVEGVEKGQSILLRDMLDSSTYSVEDHAGSRRVLLGEVIVGHLVPAAGRYFIGGAAAHLTEDTREKLSEYLGLHLAAYLREYPDRDADAFIRDRSEVLNHFVMQLPVEAPDPTILDKILEQTREALALSGVE